MKDIGRMTPEEAAAFIREALEAIPDDLAIQTIKTWAQDHKLVDELTAHLE